MFAEGMNQKGMTQQFYLPKTSGFQMFPLNCWDKLNKEYPLSYSSFICIWMFNPTLFTTEHPDAIFTFSPDLWLHVLGPSPREIVFGWDCILEKCYIIGQETSYECFLCLVAAALWYVIAQDAHPIHECRLSSWPKRHTFCEQNMTHPCTAIESR